MNNNLATFGKLVDTGDSGDYKRTYICDDQGDNVRRISMEIDTDDCDDEHAQAFKKALIALWNEQETPSVPDAQTA